jgi:hypothetical protein
VQEPTSATDAASAPTTVAVPDDALNRKRIEYLDSMREVVKIKQVFYSGGVENIDGLLAAKMALSEAKFAVASTRDERLAALEALLVDLKQVEYIQQQQQSKRGGGRVDEMISAKASRLRCEIRILEESRRDD